MTLLPAGPAPVKVSGQQCWRLPGSFAPFLITAATSLTREDTHVFPSISPLLTILWPASGSMTSERQIIQECPQGAGNTLFVQNHLQLMLHTRGAGRVGFVTSQAVLTAFAPLPE